MAFQMLSSQQIADNIKRVRKEKKISQKKLAEMIDKTERTIQNYEAGQTDFSMSIIKDIAIALDINFRELLSPQKIKMVCMLESVEKVLIKINISWNLLPM